MISVPLSPSALWFVLVLVPHSCSLCCIIACDTVLQPPVALGQLYAALLTLNSIQFIWLSYLFARRPFGQRKNPLRPDPSKCFCFCYCWCGGDNDDGPAGAPSCLKGLLLFARNLISCSHTQCNLPVAVTKQRKLSARRRRNKWKILQLNVVQVFG